MAHSHPLTPCALLGEHFTRSPEVFTLTLVNTHDTFTHYLTLWSVYFSCLIKQFFSLTQGAPPHATEHYRDPPSVGSISWYSYPHALSPVCLLPQCQCPFPQCLSNLILYPHTPFLPCYFFSLNVSFSVLLYTYTVPPDTCVFGI